MFDNKPIVVQPWTEDALLTKDPVKQVSIWVRICGLGLKFWGENCLSKLASLLGNYVRADNATIDKTRLGYARLMIEVQVGQDFPDKLYFNDEHGRQNCVLVEYEWKLIVCSLCKGIGHHQSICRKTTTATVPKVAKQVWRPKVVVAPKVGVATAVPTAQLTTVTSDCSTVMVNTSLGPDPGERDARVVAGTSYATALSSPPRSPVKSPTKKGCWNVRGINSLNKQADIKWFLHQNKIGIYGLVETKVKTNNFNTVLNNLGQRWYGINNNLHHPSGRVWIIWLPQIFQVNLVHSSSQQITVDVTDIQSGVQFWFTVVYGSNSDTERLVLWNDLQGIFDHNPCVCYRSANPVIRKSSFRYFNMWGQATDFASIIQSEWGKSIAGVRMYQVVTKLKNLKKPLKALNKQKFSDIETAAELARFLLDSLQTKLHLNPHDLALREAEQQAAKKYSTLHKAQLSYLRQKAKVEWLKDGDENSDFFHRQIKARHIQNKVLSIKDIHGKLHTDHVHIEGSFLEFYTDLLGSNRSPSPVHFPTVRTGNLVTDHHTSILLKPVTHDEIKRCIFSIPASKAPGLDGYFSQFFKDSWHIIGTDVCEAIADFFQTGSLLKQLNTTLVTLIPKITNPTSVLEFRPIACCNVVYKCIAKLLCARLGEVLPDIISPNQGALLKGGI
ncbi:uncharacterized protein LOC141641562 [Silene latifolia]|uniref:uncharacterized protein LOC141641562 n=1 Tax=Silene latifolia TaxID=37657 RepID=UPI003D77E351